ncbi:homoserine dehydrogenase [Tepidibacter formicigenes]|jgi:homoserine dehydrogenase|uniref:Homoserine dehydrogenase n=1 Tax=Tepidibacter formicigenes DSM 15518 TaxID=1123349 RepID=A0A1M6Q8E8_9FIRM|nr:homoserine dehydrogenase [Tepidibacter formicigenes]SHK16387.1 homoserine dehydrogenase [Tepidibacter formicigenes DSM 15518]
MISIAILGHGVVGSGVVEIINNNINKLNEKIGEEIKIAKILVRDVKKHLNKVNSNLLTDNIEDIFSENVDIVVEVMGGIDPAYDYIKKFLNLKKHIVTANKDLIAKHGDELLDMAKENGVRLHFEASVGGGIPILRPLSECLSGNNFNSINAILNGTTNFILSRMDKDNMDYEEALKYAQELGFAEANPESDVMGYDSARKLSILSTIAYNEKVNWEKIHIQGITDIDKNDIEFAKKIGCRIKLLGISKKENGNIYASVRPVMVNKDSSIGKIEDEFNGIVLDGDAVGNVMFYGKGAGKLPTASAVFGDIVDIIQNNRQKLACFNKKEALIQKNYQNKCKWMVRVKTENKHEIMKELADFEKFYLDINKEFKNEVIALIEVENEEILNEKINKLKKIPNVYDVKSIMVLGDN